jgi:hypothetical protein
MPVMGKLSHHSWVQYGLMEALQLMHYISSFWSSAVGFTAWYLFAVTQPKLKVVDVITHALALLYINVLSKMNILSSMLLW